MDKSYSVERGVKNMTVYLYSGTPGSGKSLHVVKDIRDKLLRGGNVIANFPINLDNIKPRKNKKLGIFKYVDNDDLTVQYLFNFYKKYHVKGKEKQTLLVIDECQTKFDPRDFRDKSRKSFNRFFSLHRKLGFNVILVSQNDRLVDRQIRCNIEYNVIHRKVNNYKFGRFIPFPVFIAIEYWYGAKLKCNSNMFFYNKKLGSLYDTFMIFNEKDLSQLENNIL